MDASARPWDVKLLYDGECPLCVREVRFMKWLNYKGRLALEDIASPDFEPSRYGRTLEQLMGHIHAVLPDGQLVTGMEAFRRSYAAVGFGAVFAPTGWPLLRPLFDAAYNWFAKNRLRLTGRGHVCENGRCAVNSTVHTASVRDH
ncbi:MAG: thiol-disulfide oxidoreductase [Myxococcaceae bacterium]|nr:thiol-disulfide oxidoreductase [Myxococcaceae bacterium]